ncbi:MAG: cupredoxin domain-containing protein [Thermomicrobiales bacterium]
MNRRRFVALASAGAAGGLLTACGNNPDAVNLSPTRVSDVAGAPTLAANATPPGSETTAGTTGGGGPELTTIELKTVDLAFEPKDFSIPADTDVTVNMTNDGALNHDFAMDTPKKFVSDVLSAQGKTTFTLNLPAGTYDYYCSQPGHKEAGMVGKITVGGSGGGPAAGGEASPAASPVAGGGPGGEAPTEASISTVDLAFDPKELTVAANTDVKITVTNKGVLQHDFHVDALNITSKMLNGGESDTVTVNAKPGTYEFWCTVTGHKEAGMVGKLIVK